MLHINNLNFSYTQKSFIKDFSLKLFPGEIITILGESGSGKSTLLKIIYGFLDWNEGEIFFNKKKLLGPKGNLVPGEDGMKWVSQSFDLQEFTTVAENVGQVFSNVNLEAKNEKIKRLVQLVDMEPFYNTPVNLLSGGQKQRVAWAKALSETPKLLLLDEPFSQVDNFRKKNLQKAVFKFIKENNISVLMVTHDINDALSYSDKILILKDGKQIALGSPENIYNDPKTEEVAKLLGEINIIDGKDFLLEDKFYFIHPHQIEFVDDGIEVEVKNSYFRGKNYMIEAKYKNYTLWIESENFQNTQHTQNIKLKI